MKEEVRMIVNSFSQSSANYLKVTVGGESLELTKKSSLVENHNPLRNKNTKEEEDSFKEVISKYVGRYEEPVLPLEVGMKVGIETVIGNIHSMGLKHDIHAHYKGTITQIFVKDGDIVEFGKSLIKIKEDK